MADNVTADPGSGGATFGTRGVTYSGDTGVQIPVSGLVEFAGSDDAKTVTDVPLGSMLGAVTETAPASDTASSGLNGRLQRIAQRLTTLIALIPGLGQTTKSASLPVTLASDQDALPITDNAGSLTVDGTVGITGTVTVTGTVTANAGTGTLAVSAASLPLPSGASTAAKQPALGTAGSASADVLTVQGTASMTALKVDGSAVTQPISGTVTANAGTGTMAVSAATLPLPSGAATAAKQPALGTAGTPSVDVLTVQGATSMTALKVDASATTQPISGTITANAGTNLNTSALALESGGNLAAIKAKTDNIPALGQALAAASVPVVLTAAQLTTLTPPAAITGYATETTLGTRLSESDFDTKAGSLTETAPATDTASSGLNGRLQRIAQRLTSLIALLPTALVGGRLDVNLGAAPATVTVTGTVTANAGTGTLAVSAASLPLPSGASTAAKQPALGTAGSASSDVLTVQGIASMTALKVDGSGVTQPVSGTVTTTSGGSGKTLKPAVVALSASGNVVAAVSGKIIKVYAYEIQSRNDGMTCQLQDDNGGSNVTPRWTLNAREGAESGPITPPSFLFKNSAQNKPVYATLTGTGTVDICVRYWDDDAS